MLHYLFLILFSLFHLVTPFNQNLIWYRIPQFLVSEHVSNFLADHKINNCFYKFEDSDTLLLKCYRNNKLVDVNINIKNINKKKNIYESLSI